MSLRSDAQPALDKEWAVHLQQLKNILSDVLGTSNLRFFSVALVFNKCM